MRQERIVFMGTPEISKVYLQSLIDHKYNVIATYTQPPRKQGRGMQIQKSATHTLSLKHNIPVYHPKNFASLESIKELKKLKPELVVIMGYGLLLPKSILQHEIDHLSGKLFVDYLSSLKRNMIIKRVQKLKKMGEI